MIRTITSTLYKRRIKVPTYIEREEVRKEINDIEAEIKNEISKCKVCKILGPFECYLHSTLHAVVSDRPDQFPVQLNY